VLEDKTLTAVYLKSSVLFAVVIDPRFTGTAAPQASTACLSPRYINALLSAERTSIMRLVVERRLERCRRALEEPAQANRTISEIAYAWGFFRSDALWPPV
jgi:AraC family transcriptional regulator, positive regulator of tynA and feaB